MFDITVLKNLNILYAEDDVEQKEAVEKTLKLLFKNVYTANDGLEAFEIFQKYNIQIVLLDYVMPNLDGYEVATKLRTLKPKIPLIIASAHNEKEKLLNSIQVQVIQYIEKPITQEKLLNVLGLAYLKLEQHNLLNIELNDAVVYSYLDNKLLFQDEEIKLSKQEVALVELLLGYKGQLVSKEVIEQEIFKESIESNTFRNIIYRLRKKIGENNLLTVQDVGYLIP
ncbi:MAG: response regulator transcription factor [Arcobacteraceae bacterium]|nr:response regulator transcription factor [Arcobacteraceae bacterium]